MSDIAEKLRNQNSSDVGVMDLMEEAADKIETIKADFENSMETIASLVKEGEAHKKEHERVVRLHEMIIRQLPKKEYESRMRELHNE